MDYVKIIDIVFNVLSTVFSILYVYLVIFGIIGFFAKKKFPLQSDKLNYAVIISARNEERVIGNLIKSIRKNDYPQDKITVFVVAHNSTDKTAEIARANGAICYEYVNENEKTKGYALKYLINKIKFDYGIFAFDGYIFFDADNVLSKNFITKMNDAFIYYGKKSMVTSYRNSKNFGKNVISAMYGLDFVYGCAFGSRARTLTGCSTRILGTGFIMPPRLLKDGWNYTTITEDLELSADHILDGNKIYYCDEAVFYDEQPTKIKVMLRQRLRWAKGQLIVVGSHTKKLIKSIFTPTNQGGNPNKGSTYDILLGVIPISLVLFFLTVLKPICLLFSPLFGIPLGEALIPWLKALPSTLLSSYLSIFFSGILVYLREHKRIKGVSFGIKILSLMVYPFYNLTIILVTVYALFCRRVEWKVIPHTDTTDFEALNVK